MAAFSEDLGFKPVRLGPVEGYLGKKNEIIYHPPRTSCPESCLVYFGGDVQDYKENMFKHRDNKHYVQWDLESTCTLLHQRFPKSHILVTKPAKMGLMTFSCFENFTEVNNFGAPTYSLVPDALRHLQALLQNVELKTPSQQEPKNELSKLPVLLVGFSKGSVVLNQLLYSFLALRDIDCAKDLENLVERISDIYWLEGGHSGSSETWVTNRAVLENFALLKKAVHIHVTPYQVHCDTRPRIGKEEKVFRDQLMRLGCAVEKVLHFENEQRSLENHFRVLEVFQKPLI